jgi:phage terminase small subunit
MAKLNEQHKRFADIYFADKEMNATHAYKAVYPSCNSDDAARASAARLLTNVNVVAYLQQKRTKLANKFEITQERILEEYAKIAFFNPKRLFEPDGKPIPISDLDDDVAAAIAGLDVQETYEGNGANREFTGYTKKYKIADKKTTLDSLAKHLGMFTENIKITADVVTTSKIDELMESIGFEKPKV